MDNLLEKTISGAIFGVLFYLGWFHLLPFLRGRKAAAVNQVEQSIEKHGFSRHYKLTHKIVKIFLYIILAILLLPFLAIFLL